MGDTDGLCEVDGVGTGVEDALPTRVAEGEGVIDGVPPGEGEEDGVLAGVGLRRGGGRGDEIQMNEIV